MLSGKWRPFCLGLNVLTGQGNASKPKLSGIVPVLSVPVQKTLTDMGKWIIYLHYELLT